jgi:biofilm PGA synthesis protein PgaA
MTFQLKKLLCFLFLLAQFGGASYARNNDDASYQKALFFAQQKNYAKALSILQPLAYKYPKPNRYFYDYLAVLGWAGKFEQIVPHEDEINLHQAPRYVLKNLAFAQREQKLFEKAQNTYLVMTKRFPRFMEARIALGLVLIDQRKTKQAETILSPLHLKYPKNIDLLYAIAYLREVENKPLQALSAYEKILILKPSDQVSYKKKVLTLNRLGASHLAYSLIEDPSLLSKPELARIRADMAAHRIRWGEIPTLRESDRFNETDQAISEINRNIVNAELELDKKSTITLNNKFDQLVALRNRYKMKEVIAASNHLEAEGVVIPPYAKNATCDAFLYLDRPNEAVRCYKEIIKTGYGSINAKVSLFYALLEAEKIPEAQKWIDQVAAEQPSILKGRGKKHILKGNPKKTQTEASKSLSIAFADDLNIANQQFSSLHKAAAYNTDLRKELANVYYWRGWPRKAQEEYEIGLHQDPKHLGLRLGQARNWLALREYPIAEQSIKQLFELFPEDKGVVKQKRLWDIQNMREFKTDISSSSSSGGTNGSRGLNIDSYLYSAPLDYNYRAYLHHRHSQADFTEGDGLLNHAGVGLEYSAPNILFNGELHHNHYDNNRVGISLSGQYEFDDHLSAGLSIESLSHETPLRALNQGIYAKSISLATQYRWHESRSAGLNFAKLKFSDGNKRRSFGGFWNERWYNQYDYKFSTRVDLFSSRNSKKDVIYFNPESDFSGSIAFENDFLTWREYENSFHQRLILSTGFYNQENFSDGSVWGLQYEHRWKTRNRFELIYGIKRSKNLYDGDYEFQWNYYLSLDWRF